MDENPIGIQAWMEGSPTLRSFLNSDLEWEAKMAIERSLGLWSEAYSPKSMIGLGKVASRLAQGPIPRGLADFLAENIVRDFIGRKSGLRGSAYLAELELITEKTKELLGALNRTSLTMRFSLGVHFLASTPLWSLPMTYNQGKVADSYIAHVEDELHVFLAAAKRAIENLPQDKGGRDGRERAAQTGIGLVSKHTLVALGLKAGGGAGGPLSQFLSLVNEAATEETFTPWADKAAERATKIYNADQKRHLTSIHP
jgi:hypothetical protein